jgi:putative ABC transport system permease protein
MLIGEIIQVALAAIRANKLRSFLTMLGIIIGIAAVITMVSLGEGARRRVAAQLQTLGTNVLTVSPGQQFQGRVDRGENKLTAKGAQAIVDMATAAIKGVSPEMSRRQQVTSGRNNGSTNIIGVWPEYFEIQNFEIVAGRMFTKSEEMGRRRVAVVGFLVGDNRLQVPTISLLGQSIQIRGIPFEVIGILGEKGGSGGFSNPDESIYIPLSTAEYRVMGSDRVSSIYVKAADEKSMDAAISDIDRALRREHRLRPGEASDFSVRDQASIIDIFEQTAQTFGLLLAGIAAVSLVVGGIGIMNIMLVSVTERTREIGVRKALGAKRRDIMFQFLIEALTLCIAGGLLGVAVGWGGAYALQQSAGWATAVSMQAVFVAIGFSAGIGLFFGLWPARRAARLDPIVSLRYE